MIMMIISMVYHLNVHIFVDVIQVEELSSGNWTDDYKRFLCELVERGEIKSFAEKHTTRHVHFTIVPATLYTEDPQELVKKLKLKSNISLQNMVAFDSAGVLKRYDSPEQIIKDFYPVRLRGYDARKRALMKQLVRDEAYARNKSQFVAQIISGELDIFQFTSAVFNKSTNTTAPRGGLSEFEIKSKLIQAGFLSQSQIEALSENNSEQSTSIAQELPDNNSSNNNTSTIEKSDFSYLLDMSIHSLTESRFESLRRQADTAATRLKELQGQSPADLWLRDLEELENALKASLNH